MSRYLECLRQEWGHWIHSNKKQRSTMTTTTAFVDGRLNLEGTRAPAMSSAVPIHPMLRLARRQAAWGVAAGNGAGARESRLAQRSFSGTLQSRAKRGKASPGIAASAPSTSTSSAGTSSSAAGAADVPSRSKKSANPSTRSEASAAAATPLPFSQETVSRGSAALRAYAASVRGKPSTPPPNVKLTDLRGEQQNKQRSQEAQRDSHEPKIAASASEARGAEDVAAAQISSAASAQDTSAPLEGAQKMLNTDAQAATAASEDFKARQGKGHESAKEQGTPLAEGVIIHANSSASKESAEARNDALRDSADTTTLGGQTIESTGESAHGQQQSARSSTPDDGSGGGGGGGSGPPLEGAPVAQDGHEDLTQILHPFDTHALVKRLQEASFVRQLPAMEGGDTDALEGTALVHGYRHDPAEAIMGAMRHLLIVRGNDVLGSHINKTEMENQSYLFSAALAELRTELQVRARNDAAALRSMVTLLQREVDALSQRMREDVAGMKHDIQVDMNNRKSEAKEEQNTLEQEIQDLNNRFTISISDLKVEIEQSIKWDATRRALTLFFGSIVILIATLTLADYLTRDLEKDSGANKSSSEGTTRASQGQAAGSSAGSGGGNYMSGPGGGNSALGVDDVRPRSAEELGVLPKYDEEQASRFV